MDFVTIDFETANRSRASACSLGLAVVKDNKIIDTAYWLIRPEPLEFDPFNVIVHGISEGDVIGSPTFDLIWPDVCKYLNGQVVVAHNASFDISVLRRTLELYNIPNPNIDIFCTYKLSTAVYPSAKNYRLDTIAKMLDIEFDHHNALSDAIVCAKILCNVSDASGAQDINGLKDKYLLELGHLDCNQHYRPCRIKDPTKKESIKDKMAAITEFCIDDDFNNMHFAFTGTLSGMPRSKAFEVVTRGGGVADSGVTRKTDYLVVGIQDFRRLNGQAESSKMRKATALQEKGSGIKIISEADFIKMIDDDLYSLCFG